jgi:hypothetical protein
VKRIDVAALRDRVIDALAQVAPQLLEDDFTLEGVLRLVVVEVRAAVAEGRASAHAGMKDQAAGPN